MATGQSDTPGHLQQCAEAIVGALQGHYWRRHGAASDDASALASRRVRAKRGQASRPGGEPKKSEGRPCPTPGARRLRHGPYVELHSRRPPSAPATYGLVPRRRPPLRISGESYRFAVVAWVESDARYRSLASLRSRNRACFASKLLVLLNL